MAFCVHCGELLGHEGVFCQKCGRPRARAERSLSNKVATTTSTAIDVRPAGEREKEFLREGPVLVTNARVVVKKQTFAMGQVSSVKSTVQAAHRVTPILLILGGMLFATNEELLGIGLIFALLGTIWLLMSRKRYIVKLSTSSGESEALASPDEGFVNRVVAAINSAMVYRR